MGRLLKLEAPKQRSFSHAHLATFSYKMIICPFLSNTENW